MTHRLLLPLLLTMLLSGCGFHLRGQIEFSPLLAVPYVNGKDSQFVSALSAGLRQSGIVPTKDPSNSTAIIDLIAVEFDRMANSIDSRGVATGYLLTYKVSYRVVNRSGRVLVENAQVGLTRNLTYQSTQVLQKEAEESALTKTMIDDIVRQMVRRLGSVSYSRIRARGFAPVSPQLQVAGS